MSLNKSVTEVLNGSVDSVHSIFPFELSIERPTLYEQPVESNELSVLIGITGDIDCRLVIDGSLSSFGYIGEQMFGIPLEGDMLYSFTGELANMIAGNLSTKVSEQHLSIDITPPTVINKPTQYQDCQQAIKVPVLMEQDHHLHLILLIKETLKSV